MNTLVQALVGLFVRCIPTVLLLLFVHFYLKLVFFRPLAAILEKRRALTEGARETAQQNLDRAAEKTAVYEMALREARSEIYREQDEVRRRLVEEQGARLEDARRRTHEMIRDAERKIAADVEAARRELASGTGMLADQITTALLRPALGRRAG